ncbi:MAG: hypothetical protein HC834_05580 [Rhodospirillales bacterium]|nr:hypothetical protein [Rhodospirillales bacterium]
MLGVPVRPLWAWVQSLVARGSAEAARSIWPVASLVDCAPSEDYADLADAVAIVHPKVARYNQLCRSTPRTNCATPLPKRLEIKQQVQCFRS